MPFKLIFFMFSYLIAHVWPISLSCVSACTEIWAGGSHNSFFHHWGWGSKLPTIAYPTIPSLVVDGSADCVIILWDSRGKPTYVDTGNVSTVWEREVSSMSDFSRTNVLQLVVVLSGWVVSNLDWSWISVCFAMLTPGSHVASFLYN